ncbi:MAG: FkbM family methyltransferase [Gemmatimonadota bacterium]
MDEPGRAGGPVARLKTTPAYAVWKRSWRGFMTSAPVWRTKRFLRQLVGTELWHWPEVSLPRRHVGGWCYCPTLLSAGDVVYSFGVGEDIDFELHLLERYELELHAFDPTPVAVGWLEERGVPDGLRFHPVGVAGHDGTASFRARPGERNPSFTLGGTSADPSSAVEAPVQRLPTLARELGHTSIALLKLDVEGAEYDAIDDLVESGLAVGQLLVEFHHRFRGVGRERTARAVEGLRDAGFRISWIAPSGREYAFVHADAL